MKGGQSGTGKTTTIKKILEQISLEREIQYLSVRKVNDLQKIIQIADTLPAGNFVIDDFHRLSTDIQEKLGNAAKIAAEEGVDTIMPKLILIGINQIGAELINLVPDIAKRCGIHKISSGVEETIIKLIENGCQQLNVVIDNPKDIFNESKGDYWLTQILCQSVCSVRDITETCERQTHINCDLDRLRESVVAKLDSAYKEAVKEFCRGKRFRRSNDPYFKLLKLIGQQNGSIVDLNKLANQNDDFKGSINNIKERRLEILLDTKEGLNRHFYYNSDTKFFAIEDPALFYYIKHLNWDELRDECGFLETDKDYEFDIAISFAGENRDLARQFQQKLEIFDVSVFFDELYEANFLGKALSKQFEKIFLTDSRFILCILDIYHHEKIWPTFERDIFKPRVAEGAVIPVYLDNTKFVGIPEELYGIDLKKGYDEDKIDNEVIKIVEALS